MQPSGGSSPLPPPPSPLPASPYQQTYSPENGLTFAPASAGTGPAPTPAPKKGPPKVVAVVVLIVFVMVVLVFSGALDGLVNPASSSTNQPDVKVTNTSASHACPYGGTPRETFLFTLVNGGSVDAAATIGFYLNDARVYVGTYSAPAGTSTPYSATATLASCPPSGSSYYLELVSVSAA